MRKLIDLDDAIEAIRFDSGRTPDDLSTKQVTTYRNGMYAAINSISSCPAIKTNPMVHGRWKYVEVIGFGSLSTCSECGDHNPETNYCPNCGAKMDGGD